MIICKISVIAWHFLTTATVEGRILFEGPNAYVADFSKDAKRQGFDGNYEKIIIEINKCVKLK